MPRRVEDGGDLARIYSVLHILGQEIVGLDLARVGELVHRVTPLEDGRCAHARSCDRHSYRYRHSIVSYQHDDVL